MYFAQAHTPSHSPQNTGLPTIVRTKTASAAHYSGPIVDISGTNYKKQQQKSTRPAISSRAPLASRGTGGVTCWNVGMVWKKDRNGKMEAQQRIKKEARLPVTVFTFVLISLTAAEPFGFSLKSLCLCSHSFSFWPVNTNQWIQSLSNTVLRTDRGSPPVLLDYRRAGEVRADWCVTGWTGEEMDEEGKGDPGCFPPLAASLV